jgi:hypothetical protein
MLELLLAIQSGAVPAAGQGRVTSLRKAAASKINN